MALERKTADDYYGDLAKLNSLRAPGMRMTEGSDADNEYRADAKLQYALEMIGHLLQRIEQLEGTDSGASHTVGAE